MDDQDVFDSMFGETEDDAQPQSAVITPQKFLEDYQNFQKIIAFTDRVDLEVVDQRTGKKTSFQQVRFSGGNTVKH